MIRHRLSTALLLAITNLLLTGAAYVKGGSLAFYWLLAFVLPVSVVTLALAVRDIFRAQLRMQAIAAVILSMPSAIWLSSIRL